MKVKRPRIRPIMILMVFSIITAIIIFRDDGLKYNFYVLAINFLIAEYSLFKIFKFSKYPFSLDNIVYLFFLFFMGIAPAQQFKQNITFWGSNLNLTDIDYWYGNLTMLFCLLLYHFSYSISRRKNTRKQRKKIQKNELKSQTSSKFAFSFVLIVLALSSTFLFTYSYNFNLVSILFRGGFSEITGDRNVSDSSLSQIVNIFVRPIPLVCLLIYKLYKKERNFTGVEVTLILITLFSNAPTGMARFQAAALYFPVLLVYLKKLRRPLNFALLFCSSLLLIFPFLNQFRDVGDFDLQPKLDTEMFVQGHFDAYQQSLAAFKSEDITYGNQLLGVLFFYVPRKFWENKPVGSGHYLAEKNNYSWSNVSMSLVGEGYLNFGIFGIILFVIVLAVLNGKMDVFFWVTNSSPPVHLYIFYLMMLGMEFFILRGDLLSSTAYTIGLLLSVFFVFKVLQKLKLIKS